MENGKWKLHHYFEDNDIELYDLQKDISENNNLAKVESKKTKELLIMLDNWRVRTQAPVPKQVNPDFIKPLNK